MAQEAKSVDVNQDEQRPFFKGYPYLVIRITFTSLLRQLNMTI